MIKGFNKAAAVISAVIMTFSMYSCGSDSDKKESSSDISDVTTAETSTVSEQTEEVTDDKSDNDSSSEADSKIDPDSVKYDFSGLKTEKYLNIFRSGRYKVKMKQDETSPTIEAYMDSKQKKALQTSDDSENDITMYTQDGKDYAISKSNKKYCITSEATQLFSTVSPYETCGYLESGEKEIDGQTYFYDKYYNVDSQQSIKLYVDKDGNFYGAENSQTMIKYDELSGDFDDSVFNILDGCTEITQQEMSNLLSGNQTSSNSN